MRNTEFLNNISKLVGDEFFSALEEVDENAIAPIALLLKVDPQSLSVLIRVAVGFVRGKVTMKDVIPSLVPVLVEYLLSLAISPKTADVVCVKNTAPNDTSEADENDISRDIEAVFCEGASPLDAYAQSESASL